MRAVAERLALALALLGAAACSSAPDEPPEGPSLSEGFTLETGTFSVAPGEETQDCYFFEVPSDQAKFIERIHLTMNEGSHHMNVFRVKTVVALGVDAKQGDVVRGAECWKAPNWKDWPLVVNTQNDGQIDFDLPTGVATRFEPRELLMLQTHYVNTGLQPTPGDAHVAIDFYGVPESRVKSELGTVFATNQNIQVCPGEVDKEYSHKCSLQLPYEATIVGANGHFHSHGTKFTMSTFDEQGTLQGQFYESTSWNEPTYERNLDVKIPVRGGVQWSCTYSAATTDCGDPAKSCCYTFGGKVQMQEHCNAFVYYYPLGETSLNCF